MISTEIHSTAALENLRLSWRVWIASGDYAGQFCFGIIYSRVPCFHVLSCVPGDERLRPLVRVHSMLSRGSSIGVVIVVYIYLKLDDELEILGCISAFVKFEHHAPTVILRV